MYLAESIPPVAVRLRRNFKSVLRLIEAQAILHELDRNIDDKGRIIAEWTDYLKVRGLIADLLSDGVGTTVPGTVRETVECVRNLSTGNTNGVADNRVAAALNLDPSAAYRRLQQALVKNYIQNLEDRPRRPGRYVIGEPLPDAIVLLTDQPPDDCTIAQTAERESDQ